MQKIQGQSDIKTIIKKLQYLFQNKQIDDFIQITQKQILQYVDLRHHGETQLKSQKIQITSQKKNKTNLNNCDKKNQKIQEAQNNLEENQIEQQLKNLENLNQEQKQVYIQQNLDLKTQDNAKQPHNKELIQNFIGKEQSLKSNDSSFVLKKQQIKQNRLQIKMETQQIKESKQSSKKQLKNKRAAQILEALKNSSFKVIEKYEDMKLLLSQMQHVILKLQEPIDQSKKWKINKLNNKSRIAVRTKGTQIEVKFQGILQANIQNLIIMIYLIELYKQCVPFCSGSKNIGSPSPLEKIALLDFKFPFLTERFAYFRGIAIDRITKNGKLYIYADGITKQKDILTKIYGVPVEEYDKKIVKSVPLDVKHALCEISNAGNNQYLFRAFAFVDSHMPQLPQKAVNYIIKQMGGWVFDKILKKANNFKGSPWEKELKQNQKRQNKQIFYTWLNQRISNWAKQQSINKSKI